MYLVQILLPLYDANGTVFPRLHYEDVVRELTARFGGVTAYTRAPATGLWEEETGRTVRDDVVVYEVMADTLDRAWWADCRVRLEARFAQDEIVLRSLAMERL